MRYFKIFHSKNMHKVFNIHGKNMHCFYNIRSKNMHNILSFSKKYDKI